MSDFLSANSTLGHYTIVSKIGAGGMGHVYLARDRTELDRRVAIKILPTEVASQPKRMQRFVQEAKTVSALNHPNVLTIFEFGQDGNTRFIAMEYVEGVTLREHLRMHRLKLHEVLDIATQVAAALDAAHEAHVVHRDIKPDNIMVRRRDHIVKVLDFGLAKPVDMLGSDGGVDSEAGTRLQVKTEPGVVMGTVAYMSPEQSEGSERIDHRTDIWSLGAVLYEMIAGRVPFEGKDVHRQVIAIQEQSVAPLSRFAEGVPDRLEDIVAKALAKDPDERYQTAKDLLIDLRNLKRKLEVDAEIDRTVPPAMRAGATISSQSVGATASGATATVIGTAPPSASSSTEYIVTGIKQHKVASVFVLAVLILGAIGLFAYLRSRTTEVAIDSIAVLPFVNVGGDPNAEYLSDGMTESIINSLSQLSNLGVIARSSVFRYKGKDTDAPTVGRELKVRSVVTGRVVQRGDNLSISVELVDTTNNHQIWGQQYNRKLADVFAVQEEIAKEISERLQVKLNGPEQKKLAKRPTENLKALQYYMQGRTYLQRRTREDLLNSIHYNEMALQEDPNYALAYAGLADAYVSLGARGYMPPVQALAKTKECAQRALALDENLAEAHSAFGYAYDAYPPFNFAQGDRELRRAVELSPSLALAHYYLGYSLSRQGRIDEAQAEFQKARELDPLSATIARAVAFPYYLKRDYPRALQLLRQANDLGPNFSATWEIGVYTQSGLFNETIADLEKAERDRKDDPIVIYFKGVAYAAQGKRAEALQTIKQLEDMSGTSQSEALWIAKVYAALGDKEMALTWLDRGLAGQSLGNFYKDEPVWDPIRSDPRFADLLRRMGVPS